MGMDDLFNKPEYQTKMEPKKEEPARKVSEPMEK
jgi:hypothetical protein